MSRKGLFLTLIPAAFCLAVGCGQGPTAAEAAKQAKHAVKDLRKAPSKGDAKAKVDDAKVEKKDPSVLEHPWTFETVRDAMDMGTVLVYKRSGKDINGKKIDDQFRWVVRSSSPSEVATSGTVVGGGEGQPSGEVAKAKWTQDSPFFALENPKRTLVKREKVTVPAGEFDCVVVELQGFFGNRKTLWLIPDKPGVYAKVHEHRNEQQEKDKTDLVWELEEITKAEGL
jgi:hypothetical protein